MKHWVCLLLMVHVLNMLWARWLNMPLLMTRFPKIQCQLLWNSLKHPINITWLKKSSMLTFLIFVSKPFGSCKIYIFMWSFSCYKQEGKIMYVCLKRFQFAKIKIGEPMKCFSSKVVMFGKCLAYNYDVL